MADVLVPGQLKPQGSTDPLADAIHLKGVDREVADGTARDAIEARYLATGLRVRTLGDGKTWRYTGSAWSDVTPELAAHASSTYALASDLTSEASARASADTALASAISAITFTSLIGAGSVAGQGVRWSGSTWAIAKFAASDLSSGDFGPTTIATKNQYQILASSSDTQPTYSVQSVVSTADATATTLYSFTPTASTSVTVSVSIQARVTDGTDDYRVDAKASFLVSNLGVVTARLALAKGAESLPTTFSIGGVTIDTSGGAIRVRVTGTTGKNIKWKALTTVEACD